MLKKIGLCLLGTLSSAAFMNTAAFSMTTHTLQPGMTMEYQLPPNDPQVFVNYMFWAIEAHCKIASEDESNDLLAEALLKKGKVNNIELTQGQSLQLTVYPNEILKLNADSGAKVKITNFGAHIVKATCTS